MFIPPYRVALSGGGVKGIAHIGALELLDERGYLRAVKEYLGISAGALCALCLCSGCTLAELRQISEQLNFGTVQALEPETVLSFPETYGLDSGAGLDRLICAILRGKSLPHTITFAELAARRIGPRLRVYATNLNTCRIDEFNETLTPTLEVRLALRASMAIPIYFAPVAHPDTGHLYVDGGVIHHSPLKFLSDDERATALSITFSQTHKPVEAIESLPTYLAQIYYALDYMFNDEVSQTNRDRVIQIEFGRFNSLHFEASVEDKRALMEAGRASAEAFLATVGRGPARPRRFSAA